MNNIFFKIFMAFSLFSISLEVVSDNQCYSESYFGSQSPQTLENTGATVSDEANSCSSCISNVFQYEIEYSDFSRTICYQNSNTGKYHYLIFNNHMYSNFPASFFAKNVYDGLGNGSTPQNDPTPVPEEKIDINEAVDNHELQWRTSGNQHWFGQSNTHQIGGDAVQSGKVIDGSQSNLKTTITGSGTLSFFWKVSSEENYDKLILEIDGVIREEISGEVDWTFKTIDITLSGSHEITWSYQKDGSESRGQDLAWIDKVTFIRDNENSAPEVLESPLWLGVDLIEANNWEAKINIQCLEKNKICGTIDFQSLSCGGTLNFLQKDSEGYIFAENIEYGNCVLNCQVHIATDGSSYKELCNNEHTGGGDLIYFLNEEEPETPVATLSENFDLHIPLIEYQTVAARKFYSADFEYIGMNSSNDMLWKLKNYELIENIDKKTIPSDLDGLFIRVYSVKLGESNYWADFKFIGNNGEQGALVWKLINSGSNDFSSDVNSWSLLIDKVQVGDIMFFNHDVSCNSDDCYSVSQVSSLGDHSYGYLSHAALISGVDRINNKIELFHARGQGYAPTEQVRKEWFDMNKLRQLYEGGVVNVKRVKDISSLDAQEIVQNAYTTYNNYLYVDVKNLITGKNTYCSKLVRSAYNDGGILLDDQDSFSGGNFFASFIFTPDELSLSNKLNFVTSWNPTSNY